MSPLYTRRHIPFFYDKSAAEFRMDPYEQYDEMVVRQTALHLADKTWNAYPFQFILDWVLENIPAENNIHIADIGCGVGRLAAELAKRFPDSEIWGLDYSYQMLRRAHEFWVEGKTIELDWSNRGIAPQKLMGHKIPNINFGLVKAEKLPFENNSQDIITHTFLLDRMDDPAITLKEIQRVLRPEGLMILISPLNFQKKENWNRFYPTGKLLDFMQKTNWEVKIWEDDFEVKEPLDARGNYISWKCVGVAAKKKN